MVETLIIGTRTYTVGLVEEIKTSDPNNLVLGEIDYPKGTIEIRKDMCKDSLDRTICHEYAHGQLHDNGLDEILKAADLEMWAQLISKCLVEFIQNNSDAVTLIQETY